MGFDKPPQYLYSKYDIYTLYFYGCPDYKNTNLHYRKMLITKRIIQGMLKCFTFCLKKIIILDPPPSDSGHVRKKVEFIFTPSLTLLIQSNGSNPNCFHWVRTKCKILKKLS